VSPSVPESQAVAFTACWHREVPQVMAYATRHVGAELAPEVVADTFLQAWRRWTDVPEEALPWLLGTARKTIANQRRSGRRRVALEDRIARLDGVARAAQDVGEIVEARTAALAALAGLSETDREALLLVVWDGLTPEQAATALGVRPGTLRVRLHRGRRRLAASLDVPAQDEQLEAHQSNTATSGSEESACIPPR
jgi:RNA polymerase sigma factor (sigma-70 family)